MREVPIWPSCSIVSGNQFSGGSFAPDNLAHLLPFWRPVENANVAQNIPSSSSRNLRHAIARSAHLAQLFDCFGKSVLWRLMLRLFIAA